METYAQYTITLAPQVASVVMRELEAYHAKMCNHIEPANFPQEFRVEGVITIERLKLIKNFESRLIQNPNYYTNVPIINCGQEYASHRPHPEALYKDLVQITIDVWQYTNL